MALKDLVGKVAPALGAAFGGPLGAAAIAILAEVFDTRPEEAAVEAAMKSADPEVIKANLNRAEAAFKAAAEDAVTVRAQISAHVEMMRMDYDRGGFYGWWRPLAGWIATAYSGLTCAIVLRDAWMGQYGFLAQAPSMLMVGGPIMAIAGIYAFGKSQERVAATRAPSPVTGLGELASSVLERIRR